MQQQQTATDAMMNNERGRPATQAQCINEKYYKSGELHWRAGVAPHDANEGHATHDGSHQPRQNEGTRGEVKVLALSRDFNELLMLPPRALIQQADIEDYKSTRDRVANRRGRLALKNPDAMEYDAVHQSTGHADAWEDNNEAFDVDAVNTKSGLQQSALHTPHPRGKGGKAGGKGGGNKGKGKGEWNGFCSYCGKKGHGPRDSWTKGGEQREDRRRGG